MNLVVIVKKVDYIYKVWKKLNFLPHQASAGSKLKLRYLFFKGLFTFFEAYMSDSQRYTLTNEEDMDLFMVNFPQFSSLSQLHTSANQ